MRENGSIGEAISSWSRQTSGCCPTVAQWFSNGSPNSGESGYIKVCHPVAQNGLIRRWKIGDRKSALEPGQKRIGFIVTAQLLQTDTSANNAALSKHPLRGTYVFQTLNQPHRFIMLPNDTSQVLFICIWSLATLGVGLICGFLIGKFYTLSRESKHLKKDREKTLCGLITLMNSTNQLNVDVELHNSVLADAKQELELMDREDHLDELQTALISNITRVVESNRKLENDLVVSRFQLESQAQELDRSRHEARTDALCNVGNRKAVDETLQFLVSRFQKDPESSFGLMLIDIDHFKRINDAFGHQAGDQVLTSISLVLKQCVRPEDFVGRLGGDEFCILLDGLSDADAQIVGARIRSTIELYDFQLDHSGQTTVVTMSMGLAVIRPGDDAVSLYERADKALYKSKELGRNRLCTIADSTTEMTGETKLPDYVSYEEFKNQVTR